MYNFKFLPSAWQASKLFSRSAPWLVSRTKVISGWRGCDWGGRFGRGGSPFLDPSQIESRIFRLEAQRRTRFTRPSMLDANAVLSSGVKCRPARRHDISLYVFRQHRSPNASNVGFTLPRPHANTVKPICKRTGGGRIGSSLCDVGPSVLNPCGQTEAEKHRPDGVIS